MTNARPLWSLALVIRALDVTGTMIYFTVARAIFGWVGV